MALFGLFPIDGSLAEEAGQAEEEAASLPPCHRKYLACSRTAQG